MVRVLIIGIVIAVAFTLYSLVDAAMTDHSRARGVSKPVWIVIIVLLPVVGAILWMVVGKGEPASASRPTVAPDDDPRFSRPRMSEAEIDAHMRDLEARLKELDDEVFPGEPPTNASPTPASPTQASPSQPSDTSGSDDTADGSGSVDDTSTDTDTGAPAEGSNSTENQEKER